MGYHEDDRSVRHELNSSVPTLESGQVEEQIDECDGPQMDNIFETGTTSPTYWNLCGDDVPRSQFVFFAQLLVILIILIVSIINLSIVNTCEETTVWVALLSSAVGYALPAPKL